MKRKTLMLSIIAFLIVITCMVLGSMEVKKSDERTRQECLAKGFECPSTLIVHLYEECYNDCLELKLKHYKLDRSGFGSHECWCLKEELPYQIW